MYRKIGLVALAHVVLALYVVPSSAQGPDNVPEARLEQTLSNAPHWTELHFAAGDKLLVLWHFSSMNEPLLSVYEIYKVEVPRQNPVSPDSHKLHEVYNPLAGSELFGKAELDSQQNRTRPSPIFTRNGLARVQQSFRQEGIRLTLSPDGRTLATLSLHEVRMWEIATGKQIGAGSEQDGSVLAAFTRDGKRLLTVSVTGHTRQHQLRLWDAASFEPIGETATRPAPGTKGYHARMKSLLWSTDDKFFLSAHSPNTVGEATFIQFWDSATMKPSGAPIPALGDFHQFSPDGKALMVVAKKEVTLWDVAARKLISRLSTPEVVKKWGHWDQRRAANQNRWFAVHPSGTRVLYAPGDEVQLWDLATDPPAQKQVLKHARPVYWVEISPDGKQAATADGAQVLVWDVEIGRPMLKLPLNDLGHGKIKSMKFSPDGRFLATATDRNVQLWEVRTKQ